MFEHNSIVISGDYPDLSKAIQAWIDLYSEGIGAITIDLYEDNKKKYYIKAEQHLDNFSFSTLVNYLYYPEYLTHNVKITGFTILNDKKYFPEELINRQAIVFVPVTDTEHDNVYFIIDNNEVVKLDFGGKIKRNIKGIEFDYPTLENSNLRFIKKFTSKPLPSKEKQIKTEYENAAGRFYGILKIAVLAFLVPFLFLDDLTLFGELNSFLAFLVWVWFYEDYKILRYKNLYFHSIIVSLMVLGYGIILTVGFNIGVTIPIAFAIPLIFLSIQKFARVIFIQTLGREPVIDNHSSKFPDIIYSIILLMCSLVLPAILFKNYL